MCGKLEETEGKLKLLLVLNEFQKLKRFATVLGSKLGKILHFFVNLSKFSSAVGIQ